MKDKIEHIVNWIKNYAKENNFDTLVVGVSGGIDSAVTSTLCAMTGLRTMPIVMSIRNKDILALEHTWWLDEKFNNVSRRVINLEKIFHEFEHASNYLGADNELAFANGWQVAELKPDVSSEANNIKSFQLRFATDGTVPSGFEINDISIVYRIKSIR